MPTDLPSNNIVIAGPARGGTTLACVLLNDERVVNTVALDEPFQREKLEQMGPSTFMDHVDAEFARFREMILTQGKAFSTRGSKGVQNHYNVDSTGSGLRNRVVEAGEIDVNKEVDDDFLLVVKHTLPFTAVIDRLMERYPVYIVVRNPLAILASWNTIQASYERGEVQPYVANLTGDLIEYLQGIEDRIERQVALLNWHFERYLPLLRNGCVIQYEDVISSQGRALSVVAPSANQLDQPLASRNSNPLYKREIVERLASTLKRLGGPVWEFYSVENVDDLCQLLLAESS